MIKQVAFLFFSLCSVCLLGQEVEGGEGKSIFLSPEFRLFHRGDIANTSAVFSLSYGLGANIERKFSRGFLSGSLMVDRKGDKNRFLEDGNDRFYLDLGFGGGAMLGKKRNWIISGELYTGIYLFGHQKGFTFISSGRVISPDIKPIDFGIETNLAYQINLPNNYLQIGLMESLGFISIFDGTVSRNYTAGITLAYGFGVK